MAEKRECACGCGQAVDEYGDLIRSSRELRLEEERRRFGKSVLGPCFEEWWNSCFPGRPLPDYITFDDMPRSFIVALRKGVEVTFESGDMLAWDDGRGMTIPIRPFVALTSIDPRMLAKVDVSPVEPEADEPVEVAVKPETILRRGLW
jgi:hypothetical protein